MDVLNMRYAAWLDANRRAEFEDALRRSAKRSSWRGGAHAGAQAAFARAAATLRPWRAITRAGCAFAQGLVRQARQHALSKWDPLRRALGRMAAAVPLRKLATGMAATACAIVAVAATLVVAGYAQDPAPLLQRVHDRRGVAIFSDDRQLLGAVYPRNTKSAGINFADYGYIALEGNPPEKWVRYITTLEQRTLFDSYRSVCGIDALGMAKRIVTGVGGGSGLAQQLVKGLHEPDQVRSPNLLTGAFQKLVEVGEACRLHQALGGAEGVLKLYAAYAPVSQINGVTRGIEAGAWTLFGKSPADLSDVEAAILAAAVQRPIAAVPAAAFANTADDPPAAGEAEAAQVRQANAQRRMLRRARHALKQVLVGPQLDAAIDEIAGLMRTGVQPVNPFAPISAKRVVNLSSRTTAALTPGMVARVAQEADALDLEPGKPITLTISQKSQSAFVADVSKALDTIDTSASGREQFCVALGAGGRHRHCAGAPEGRARADVVLARVDIASGGFKKLYESNRLAFGAPNSMGSVAKSVIALAAVKQGLRAGSLLCPRSARDGVRHLRRETKPEWGYPQCGSGQLITFAEAIARSDNLAVYDLARQLGDERLREALNVLGLTAATSTKNVAFDLSFGTQAATPSELLQMGQALFAVAFELPVRSAAPHLLSMVDSEPVVYAAVRNYLPDPAQRRELRLVLEAPVTHPRGTLHTYGAALGAGKTGTVSSALRPSGGRRPYVGGKYVLGYLPSDHSVALISITAPAPHPLGVSWLHGALLAPAATPLFR